MLTIYPFLLFGTVGTSELLIVFVILLLLFGASKLPQLGGALGKTVKNFKKEMKEGQEETVLKCPKCETEIADKSAEFCSKCGQKVK
jgi:sec-independent protein translocase protein TatA